MFKLFRFLKPYRYWIPVSLTLIFLQSMANLYLPRLMSDIVDQGVLAGDVGRIVRIGGNMLAVTFAGACCSVLASLVAARVSASFGRDLRAAVFAHVTEFTLHEFDTFGTASLITRTTNDVSQVQQMVNMMLRMMIMAPMMCIGGIVMAIVTDPGLSLVIVVVVPLLALILWSVLGKGFRLFRAVQRKVDKVNRVLRENLTGIRVVRAFNRVAYEERRFDEASRDLTTTAVAAAQTMAVLWPLATLVMNFATLAILWFGALRIDALEMQVGHLMAFLQYLMQILFAIMMVSMMTFMIPRASASAQRIQDVLATPPSIRDRDSAPDPPAAGGLVEFEDVTFSYPGAERPALAHVSFTARPGQVTAIIGGTGSGKTTLVNLIMRFYDVNSGAVRVDGVDVRDMPQASLRRRIGYVPQRAVLFSGTVADNIRYGKEDADVDEVQRAAVIAQAADFVAEMPEGYDSFIAQGGINVSGGQKQRLSIARALVRRPEIYIFDDSFSALDFRTDARLRAALRQEVAGATVIIVAQRVNTVIDADQIIVLDEGRVAGIGRHQDLLAGCRVYQEIVASQLAGEEGIA
ncbi:MAG: ABC transporter ATP-binding protein [Alicyclobacillaceae bacterium]|nr:ABC transporter ATP-binding protein [Alicyclobacillaceae bacterium]